MKLVEVRIGAYYKAKVNKKMVVVQVLEVSEADAGGASGSRWLVLNLTTKKKLTFVSIRRFIEEVKVVEGEIGDAAPDTMEGEQIPNPTVVEGEQVADFTHGVTQLIPSVQSVETTTPSATVGSGEGEQTPPPYEEYGFDYPFERGGG